MIFDFERATWIAISTVFPNVYAHGCTFHFFQALVKRINEEGLAYAYAKEPGTRELLKEMMALCYFPAKWIPNLFYKLKVKCTTPNLIAFVVYTEKTWIESTIFPPYAWSAFGYFKRTTNPFQGWHR